MATTWGTVATTWTTETAKWNTFPVDYLYTGAVGVIVPVASAGSSVRAATGAVAAIFGVASANSFGYEILYTGTVTVVFSVELDNLVIKTWTPSSTPTNTWVEEASL